MSYQAKVIAGGKIVIPAELRRELGIEEGDSLVLERDSAGGIAIKTYAQVVREVQHAWRTMVGDYTVDQFLEDRQTETALENERLNGTSS